MNIKIKRRDLINILNIMVSSLIFLFAWLIGNYFNVNIITMLVYFLSMLILYKYNKEFVLKYIYIIIINSIFILGVFFCEIDGTYLNEIEKITGYTNCFNLALFACHIFLFFCLISNNTNYKNKEEESKTNPKYNLFIKCICIGTVLIQIFALVNILMTLKGSLFKIDRFIINRQYLSNFVLKVKNNIILALPLFYFLKSKRKNVYLILYLLLYFFIMLFTGEKYGPYIKLFYLLLLFFPNTFNYIKKHTYIFVLFFCFIIMIVFVQYKSLYGFTYRNLTEYLQSRLCQQGQVWWSTYNDGKILSTENNNFSYEIEAAYNSRLLTTYPYAGQWKMMYHSTNGSALFQSRVKNLIPFTATTLSSVYYYFGFVGIFIVYPLFGLLYSILIKALFSSCKKNLIMSILGIKLFIMFDYLYSASDLSSLISIKSLMFIMLFLIIKTLEKKEEKI